MLTEAIMHDCVVKLLKNHDEESLECLCRLLTTIGKDLDFEKAKVGRDRELEMSRSGAEKWVWVVFFEDLLFLSGISVGREEIIALLWVFHHGLALLPPLRPFLIESVSFSIEFSKIFHPNLSGSRNAQH